METLARRRWQPLAILAAAIVVYWLAMFAATHLPFRTTPAGDPYSLDKLQHISAFAIFAVLLCVAGSVAGISRVPLFFGVLGLIAAYAGVDEFSQQFVAERTPDFFDWLADICGAGLGIIAFMVIRGWYLRRQARFAASETAA